MNEGQLNGPAISLCSGGRHGGLSSFFRYTINLLVRNGLNVLYYYSCEDQVAYALFVLLIALS